MRNIRDSERIFVVIPVRILVRGVREGESFAVEGETLDVSRHGATISAGRKLYPGQTISISRIGLVANQADARVIREILGRLPNVYAVGFLDRAVNIWDITFPPAKESEKAVLRALLRCPSCQGLEVTYLDEFESELFLAHHHLPRLCSKCGGWTTWTQPHGQMFAANGEMHHAGVNPRQGSSGVILARGEQNRRTHGRVRPETVACVRFADNGYEVVVAADLGRGGLSFISRTKYTDGSMIEIAVPYSSRAPNIFVPARIVGSRSSAAEGCNQYSVSFIR